MGRNVSLIKVFCLTITALFLTQTYYASFFKHWLILYSASEDMLRKAMILLMPSSIKDSIPKENREACL